MLSLVRKEQFKTSTVDRQLHGNDLKSIYFPEFYNDRDHIPICEFFIHCNLDLSEFMRLL